MNDSVNFSTLFSPEQVLCDLDDTRLDHAIRQLIVCIADSEPSIDIDKVYQLVFKRKSCGMLLLRPKVAVVHIRVEGLQKLRVAIASRRDGLLCSSLHKKRDCGGEDFERVNIVVLMMAPPDQPVYYLRAVSALQRICRHDDFIEQLLSLDNSESFWQQFNNSEEQLPEYLQAHHIMRTDFSRLNISDKLSQAIDLFCQEKQGEYPVVDDEGELSGIVNEELLIRLCLPEYITWMEDLEPILNFEPFAEILKYEQDLPVMEIMAFAESYITVEEATPAIQVARLMMRRDVQQVFVLRDKKLTGVISINDIIHKILRS